jgi:LAS superfamily LD-carboxypeptidase LdcB
MNEHSAKSGPLVNALSGLELTGRAHTHVRQVAGLGCALHPQAAAALQALRATATQEGIDLRPVSGFRDFAQQLAIWNAKFRGARPLLDANGDRLDALALDEVRRVAAILVWSALPGASRHHWGSDCDVIDRNALAAGTPVELLVPEYGPGGRYAHLSAWLDRHAYDYGFFRPYDRDRGGVQAEPWHLSFAPVAVPALAALTPQLLCEALADVELAGRAAVEDRLPLLFERYVTAVAMAPAPALAAAALSRGARLA